jgi:hypothetical protein
MSAYASAADDLFGDVLCAESAAYEAGARAARSDQQAGGGAYLEGTDTGFARGYELGFELGFMQHASRAVVERGTGTGTRRERTVKHFHKLEENIKNFPAQVNIFVSYISLLEALSHLQLAC